MLVIGIPLPNRGYWQKFYSKDDLRASQKALGPLLRSYRRFDPMRIGGMANDEEYYQTASSIAANGAIALPALLELAGRTQIRLFGPWNSPSPFPIPLPAEPFLSHAREAIERIRDPAAIAALRRINATSLDPYSLEIHRASTAALLVMRARLSAAELREIINDPDDSDWTRNWKDTLAVVQGLQEPDKSQFLVAMLNYGETYSVADDGIPMQLEISSALSDLCTLEGNRALKAALKRCRSAASATSTDKESAPHEWSLVSAYEEAMREASSCPELQSSLGDRRPLTCRNWEFRVFAKGFHTPQANVTVMFDGSAITDSSGARWQSKKVLLTPLNVRRYLMSYLKIEWKAPVPLRLAPDMRFEVADLEGARPEVVTSATCLGWSR